MARSYSQRYQRMGRLTASEVFSALPSSTSAYVMNPPVTPSLMNYVPSSVGGSSFHDPPSSDSLSEEEPLATINVTQRHWEYEDERCQALWSAFRDAAGPWMSHRFTLSEWDTFKPKGPPKCEMEQGEIDYDIFFDGILTKEIIAPNLYRVDKCPEFQHYALTKCILVKKRLTNIDILKSYHYIQYLDVSSNKLTTLKPLGNLPFLKILDASHNLLTAILDFKAPYYLTIVNLSYNKIKLMGDLSSFWSITDLNLSHNCIRVIDGVKELRYLTSLNLSSNRIEAIENLDFLRVQFLFLQSNMIQLHGYDRKAKLDTLKNIRTINLSYNQVSSLKMFEAVENLEYLDIVNNNISQLLDIYYLRNLKYLNKLNLTGNPVTNLRRYIDVCVTEIKHLIVLDGEHLSTDMWLKKRTEATADVSQVAAHSRLKLLVLEQLNPPQIWHWLLPYDCPPIAVIVLVGLQASNRAYIARTFCTGQKNVVVGIPYTTKPRHKNEVQGDYFYYVDEETFMTMLKNGQFLTYQESLGSYYGIAHSELKKAECGIVLFYTDLTMALAIKRKFLNTVLVLSLPSTTQAHLAKLHTLFAVQFIDKDTLKIVNSPVAAAECRQEFAKEKQKLLMSDARAVVDDMVTNACYLSEERIGSFATEKPPVVKDDEQPWRAGELSNASSVQPSTTDTSRSDIFQLWWACTPTNVLSLVIQPGHVESMESATGFKAEMDPLPKATLETAQNTTQMKRYVSFTVAHVHKISDSEESSDQEPQNRVQTSEASKLENPKTLMKTINLDHKESATSSRMIEEPKLSQDDELELDPSVRSPVHSKKFFEEHRDYSDLLSNDARIKSIFDEELRQREELLELHLDMPGLFREMLYTDREEETMDKLKALVHDITRYNEVNRKAMLNLEHDKHFKRLTKDKIANCFKELRNINSSKPLCGELSVSEKQAEEYIVQAKGYSRVCSETICEEPTCPKW